MRSSADSGFCTTANCAVWSRTISGRSEATVSSFTAMRGSDILRLLDLVGEQHVLDAMLQRSGILDMRAAVQLGLDLAGMRRQQQDAGADLDRFRNRMGHEQHRKPRLFPQSQQFVLHLAAGERVEGCERLV